ncbi:MAG: RluA family pseudouridine synthase [Lewinellaceae bacterium]|nr:RluA family pseudouridine synthase [Lewinellaceae bacterium]
MKLDLSAFENFGKKGSFEDHYTIIDETDDFFVVFKRYGIPVQVTDNEQMDLEGFLNAKFGGKVHVLNRIDQPVSGLVIFGKTREFTRIFTELLKNREVKKTYIALVSGNPNKQTTTLTHYIKKLHNRAMTSDEALDDDYKLAELEYTLIQSFDNYHALKVDLKTGRFHQIRAQMATMGMPIKGDLKYGSRRPNLDRSIGLLSYKLEFIHPKTGKHYAYTAPFPTNEVLWQLIDKELIK